MNSASLSSDDGSWLRIGGATVVDHDGPHATSEKTGRVALSKGVYPFELGYLQATGGSSLNLWLEGPGMPKQTVAGGILFHDKDPK